MYWVYLNRRTELEDRQAELETQTFNLFPERWSQLYQDKTLAEIAAATGEDYAEMPVTDIDALDQWYEQMVSRGGSAVLSGSSLPQGADQWGDWQ